MTASGYQPRPSSFVLSLGAASFSHSVIVGHGSISVTEAIATAEAEVRKRHMRHILADARRRAAT